MIIIIIKCVHITICYQHWPMTWRAVTPRPSYTTPTKEVWTAPASLPTPTPPHLHESESSPFQSCLLRRQYLCRTTTSSLAGRCQQAGLPSDLDTPPSLNTSDPPSTHTTPAYYILTNCNPNRLTQPPPSLFSLAISYPKYIWLEPIYSPIPNSN